MTTSPGQEIVVRPFRESDRPVLLGAAERLMPSSMVSPRDPAVMRDFLNREIDSLPQGATGAEAFVAEWQGQPAGLLMLHPEHDHFTQHARAYVDLLLVTPAAEGNGIGRRLMVHAEEWAREHGCCEVVLDVFASNSAAIAFYTRVGYAPDHIRMAKPLN